MKAVQIHSFGGPEVLSYEDVNTPEPGEKEVLVKVHAAGINYADTMRRQNNYVLDTPLPFIPGSEIAGEIVEAGRLVDPAFSKGRRVTALIGDSGYAEYAAVHERSLIPIPDPLSYQQAAALPLQGLSAYHILKTMGRLQEGESVLIHAAAGGVGTLAVQLARYFGAGKIIAAASTEEKRALAEKLGADVTIDYTQEDWPEKVLEATDGRGADVAMEMAGGKLFQQTLDCLAPFGRLVTYGAASGELPELNTFHLLEKNQSVIGFFLPQMMAKPQLFEYSLRELVTLAAEDRLQLHIGGVYPLKDAASVHRDMVDRKTSGKLILEP
ncbi:quinone oxidoreductase family protein [Alkalicoccus urumqiensis]|uniref:Alcohol dehydrogenase n=1 Tax=Alkalicoccus urumqiensis TaxID=1548213 RepID=A0A2P6MLQ2_ALKUR|nr:NADPH:quinone oxidoreductase family protein [Alkalicoccus urumqiensis]PRO67206.1 alcohol dehydrogenase [Alkalicoccus urumqiensis]